MIFDFIVHLMGEFIQQYNNIIEKYKSIYPFALEDYQQLIAFNTSIIITLGKILHTQSCLTQEESSMTKSYLYQLRDIKFSLETILQYQQQYPN